MTSPTTVTDLVDVLLASGGRPALTAYDAGGERVELSGAVLANWVAKTTNLLVEEFDVEPGTAVEVDLPAHWRTLVWALATWRAGGCVTLDPATGPGLVVTDRPAEHTGTDGLVAVALPALARRFDGAVPAGTVDAAAAVMTYGDVIGWTQATDPDAPALVALGAGVPHRDLADWARPGDVAGQGARVLLEAPADRSGVAAWLRTALGVLLSGGSLVLLGAGAAAELAADPARRANLLSTERVTAQA